jgi:hypothetical protein
MKKVKKVCRMERMNLNHPIVLGGLKTMINSFLNIQDE